MKPLKNPARLGLALGTALALPGALVTACSNSSNETPLVYGNDAALDSTTNVGDGSQGSPDSSPDATLTPDGQSPVDGAGPDVAADAGDSGSTTPTCTSALTDAGCWTCPAASDGSIEFLNRCSGTGVKCVGFDNSKLPGFDAGGRPSLN